MKNLLFILLTTSSITLYTQSEKLDKKIIGTWNMEKVYKYNKDVTQKHNPKETDGLNSYQAF